MTIHTIHGLSDAHYEELHTGSAISDIRIRQRYYQTVTADQLPPEFADYQRRPGLLIPIRSVRGQVESWQLKPDQPRIGKNGKPIKYETAANCPQIIDCPPQTEKLLGNPRMPLVITEGAKKVDAAVSNGLTCTIGLQGVYGWRGTNGHGGKTALADWEHIALNNRTVFIAFDSDVMTKPEVRDALDRLSGFLRGKGAKVSYILMPNLPDGSKCGLDDWFANGHDRDELARLNVAELPTSIAPNGPGTNQEDAAIPRLVSRTMRDVEQKEIEWLWPGWLPKGMLALLGGYAGDGKSTLTAWLAAALSTGARLPDGATAPITNTLMVLTEDDVSHIVKGRLVLHGVDEDRVHALDHVQFPDGSTRLFNLKTDIPYLHRMVAEHGIGLIVIDPLSGVMGNSDRNNEGEVRDILTRLAKMAEETGCTVLGIMHIGKTDGQAKSYQKLMGSTAYTAVARTVWMLSELPADYQEDDQPTKRMLGVSKSNYAVPPKPLQYHRPQGQAIEWLGESPLGIDAVFSRLKKAADDEDRTPNQTEKAEEWLLKYMDGKRVLASQIEAAAKDEGFSETTLRKAKKGLNVRSVRENQKWYWVPSQDDSVRIA